MMQMQNMPTRTRTSSMMSQSRPGVATRTSAPRSSILRCFCEDMPPTTAAMLTSGGFLGFLEDSAVCSSFSGSIASLGILVTFAAEAFSSLEITQSFRCDDTCKASSRVGAKMSARSLRFARRGR
jgi:hypothetical protein